VSPVKNGRTPRTSIATKRGMNARRKVCIAFTIFKCQISFLFSRKYEIEN